MKTVIVLNNDQMGHGAPELGQKILGTFLRKLTAMRYVTAIVLFNSGVKLVTRGSPVLAELIHLHEAGVDIRPCGTCLEFYGLKDQLAVSTISGMDDIIRELDAAEKVITL